MNTERGPVEQAVRNVLHKGSTLRTPRGQDRDEFRVTELGAEGLKVSKVEPVITWDELEGVVHFLNVRGGEAKIGATKNIPEPGTLDEYFKKTRGTMRSSYAASILEEAGVVEIDRGIPHIIRLALRFVKQQQTTLRLRSSVHAVIYRGDNYFVADCLEIPVVTQGLTVDETLTNLREAVELHMEDEDLDEVGLIRHPTISITMELETADGPA